jgi:signal transduction histidine kinase/ActR/RegA family two-component response regulator
LETPVEEPADGRDLLVVIFALFGRDAAITQRILKAEGIASEICTTLDGLVDAIARGAGAVVLAEETLVPSGNEALTRQLRSQESWSDLPIIVSASEASGGREGFGVLNALGEAGNVILLERPVHVRAMVGAVQSALRARRRQYASRDVLRVLAASEAELKRLVAREREARAYVESVSRSKDEFLATISHELRTPLNAVLGWARMLNTRQLGADARVRALQAIERNAVAQAKLIEDLLDMGRIISGKLRIAFEVVTLPVVIDAAVETVKPALQAKGIHFEARVDPEACVMGDPGRLQQIVWNLLSNAVKFTPKGGHVRLTLARADAFVELEVSDEGQGITPSFLPHVFQRFHQQDGSTTRSHGGLGLGLAICRQLVELHGGTIEAESEGVGRGAAFRVRLPAMAMRETPASPPVRAARVDDDAPLAPARELESLRLLIVDDQADARELVAAVVASCGARPIQAASAAEAFSLIARERPDIIVSDIGMPLEDGYSFIRRVRALPASQGGRTPAVALTAYVRAEDGQKAADAGFELHLPKPVEPADLLSALGTLAHIARELRE